MKNDVEKPSLWNRFEQYVKKHHIAYLEKKLGKEVLLPGLVNFSEIKSILVVRQHDQLGDFLLSTPVLRALRAHFPKARIGVVVREYFADIVLQNPCVDEVLVFHEDGAKWSLRRIIDFWKQLRSGWELAIVLNTVSHSLTSDLIAHFSRAKFILGSAHKIFPECDRNFIYNLVAPYWPHARHQTDRNLDILRHIGVDASNLSEFMCIEKSEIEAARKELHDLSFKPGKLAVGIHVGAGKLYNRWPIGRYGELAQLLKDHNDVQVLLFWGPGEEQLAEHFCKYTQFTPIKIAPVSIRKLSAYFKHCDAIVCNDTGVMHLAAAVSVPLLAIFGPTDPAEWKPIGDKFLALRGARSCTDAISVKQAYTTLAQLLPGRIALPNEYASSSTGNAFKKIDLNAQFDISESVLRRYVESLDKLGKAVR